MEPDDPDVRLMLAFKDGKDSAFEQLFERWSISLLRYLERMVMDAATAEELVQETFLRVHGARERYRPEARFSTWIFRIATNLALNELDRARRRHPHDSTDREPGPEERRPRLELVAGGSGVDDRADARRLSATLLEALAELPERQRMAIWLSAVEGHSYAEIGQVLEATEKGVKALVHRARVGITTAMARHQAGPAADASSSDRAGQEGRG